MGLRLVDTSLPPLDRTKLQYMLLPKITVLYVTPNNTKIVRLLLL